LLVRAAGLLLLLELGFGIDAFLFARVLWNGFG
jgi:hypothetical protein